MTMLVRPASMAYMKAQTAKVQALNVELAREDAVLSSEEKQEESRVRAVRKAHQLAQERQHADAEAHRNAELQLQNQELREQLLQSHLATKRAKIEEMKEQVKAGHFSRARRTNKVKVHTPEVTFVSKDPLNLQQHAKDPFNMHTARKMAAKRQGVGAQSPLAQIAPSQLLAGKYVKVCSQGKRCHRGYLPETLQHWRDAHHTEEVMERGLPLPVGPTTRRRMSALGSPSHDTPRPEAKHSIYGVYTGSFFGPSDSRFADTFVSAKDSGLEGHDALAPWLRSSDKEEEGGAEDTMDAMNGTRKVYGDVYDLLPLSGAKKYDSKQARLEKEGVNVGDLLGLHEQHHLWNGAGKDSYHTPSHVKVAWDKGATAQWAWNNNAMPSLNWEAEGKQNKDLRLKQNKDLRKHNNDLMLRVTWNDTHPSPFVTSFADTFVDHHHPQGPASSSSSSRDQFADWGAKASRNLRLLYGSSLSFNYRVNHSGTHDQDWEKEEWGMADNEHHQRLSSTPPTAEWGTPNIVGADMTRAGRASDSVPYSQQPGAERARKAMEKAGVKVAGYSMHDLVHDVVVDQDPAAH